MVKVPKYTEIIKLIYPTDPSFHGFPWKKNRSICHALALSFSYSWERLAIKRPRHLWSAWCCCYCELSIIGLEKRDMLQSKVTFPNLPPAQGCASPSRKLVLPQIDHNYTVGVFYVYVCIDCQSSILSHMVPELINNLICWNCKGCIGKSIGPVQYRFTIPSLLAQCHVAGSMPRCCLSAS